MRCRDYFLLSKASRTLNMADCFLWQLSFPAAPTLLMCLLTQYTPCFFLVAIFHQLLSTLDLWRVYFAELQSPTGPKKRIQGGDCCPRRTSLLRFPWLFPIRNSSELRGLHRRSYFGPRTCGGGITNVIEVSGLSIGVSPSHP